MNSIRNVWLGAALVALAACGGAQKKGAAGTASSDGGTGPNAPALSEFTKEEPKREISNDARKDYEAAAAFYKDQDKGTWKESGCRQAAERFETVARNHRELVEAHYMIGRSYHNCNLLSDAERAYQAAIKVKANHGASMSNLGEIAFRNGKTADAKRYWEGAVKANPKLVAAYNNLAGLLLEELRKTREDGAWAKMEKQARDYLSTALAVDNDNVKAYVLYGLVYMEGRQKNKNRLDLAKLLLDEGKKRQEKYAPLQNAYGLYYMNRSNLRDALISFQQAVELDGSFAEARMNVGLINLGFRKYDAAKEQFTKVTELEPKNYDAYIGLGIAQRGLGDLDGAEASYKKARELDGRRGDALFNLGVLYKDFRAAKQADLRASQTAYRTARDFFKEYLNKDGSGDDKDEAKANIADCDKVIKQLDDFIKATANQPAAPAGGGK
jgi:tetratricopeptide (TPR) repeat protein